MQPYKDMIQEVLKYGTRKENRTGVDTISTFNFNYEISWDQGFGSPGIHHIGGLEDGSYPVPLLTTKEVSWKNIVVEMLWFLSGEPTIEILQRHGCKFWDAWSDKDGRVPMAYGEQWRRFPVHSFQDTTGTKAHMATNTGTTPWCRTDSAKGDTWPVVETNRLPQNWEWCPNCVQVWKDLYPTRELPKPQAPVRQGALMHGYNDQLKWALEELRRNPMSRRVIVSAWAPGMAQTAKLPPCHMIFAFNVQNVEETLEATVQRALEATKGENNEARAKLAEHYMAAGSESRAKLRAYLEDEGFTPKVEPRLCLHLTQRSCDLALGVPYNMASYGLLLLIFSHLTGIKPGIFAHTLLDLHIYCDKPDGSMAEYNHIPGLREQAERECKPLPRLTIDPSIKELSDIEALMAPDVSTEMILEKFKLTGYDPAPAIKFKVAV